MDFGSKGSLCPTSTNLLCRDKTKTSGQVYEVDFKFLTHKKVVTYLKFPLGLLVVNETLTKTVNSPKSETPLLISKEKTGSLGPY